ncbi:MAG: hypothetical protein M3Z56_06165 [Bacteroidota bacterium]|nr:hypothetical protein [Bacteroidota bacterium]
MITGQYTKLLILLFYIIACVNKNHGETAGKATIAITTVVPHANVADTFETGKVTDSIFCKKDSVQSYALYIPAKGSKLALPVIYFFDPHGDGSLPLNKFKALADEYHIILAGSNNSKNGNDWPATEKIWNVLFDDSQNRLQINNNRIYTCGFSGGAKVATYIGLKHHEVKGVIANGAGLPDIISAGNFPFSFTAITGEGDMNMTDLVAVNTALDKTQTRHRIIFFDGKHEWAPESAMRIAFTGLQLDAMREKLIPADAAFVNSYIEQSRKKIAAYLNSGNYIKAEAACELSISILNGLANEVNWFKEKEAAIRSDMTYKKQWLTEQNLLETEQNMKETYNQQFGKGDRDYWIKTINDLHAKAKIKTPEGSMYQRLIAYLSLAFYSISNQLINGNQNDNAQHFVDLYKIADATNSEAWYFSAILNARNHNAKAAQDDLLKAVANGFTDKKRMMQQPEFQNAGAPLNLPEVEAKMKGRK